MRSPGIVDISFLYPSPPYAGVAVDSLIAYIYDSSGNLRDTLTYGVDGALQQIVGANTSYQILGYDVSNYELFPKSWVQVVWQVGKGSESPTFNTSHWFVPYAPYAPQSRLVSWSASTSDDLISYYLESKQSDQANYTFLAATPFTSFIDKTTYQLPSWFNSIDYRVTELIWGPSPGSPGPILGSVISPVSSTVSANPLCLIHGSVLQINNTVEEVDFIRFFVDHKAAPVNVGSTYYLQNRELVVPLDSEGKFAVCLPQGVIVTCEVPSIGFTKRFIVPAQDTASLDSVTGTVIEIYRAP